MVRHLDRFFMSSLFLPEQDLTLVAIDPGSTKCGFAVFVINLKEKKIKSIIADTIMVESLANDTGFHDECVPAATLRYYKLRNEITRRLTTLHPSYIAYEGPFMNTFNPNAYAPLVSVMTLVRDAVLDYNLSIPFFVYQPQVVKMTLNVAGKKGKEVVVAALRKVQQVMDVLEVDLDSLDDNGVDSIVVGYTFFLREIEKLDRLIAKRRKK